MNSKIGLLLMALVLCVVCVTITALVINDMGTFEEVTEEVVDIPADEGVEAPPSPRQWSVYMQEWLQTNRLVIDYLNVSEKEWCAIAIRRVDPEHPDAEPTIECIN